MGSPPSPEYHPSSPNFIQALVVTESERDLSIGKQSAIQSPYTTGHPTTTKNNRVVRIGSPPFFKQNRNIVLTENSLSTHRDGLADIAARPDTRVEEDGERALFLGAAPPL